MRMRRIGSIAASFLLLLGSGSVATTAEPDIQTAEQQFRELPMEARRLTGPLFWLHGDDSRERLDM